MHVLKALHADAEAIDSAAAIAFEEAVFGCAWVDFQRNLCLVVECHRACCCIQKAGDCVRRKETRRATAKKNALNGTVCKMVGFKGKIANQRVDIGLTRQLTVDCMGIKIAVGAFTHTPREVYIQRHWRLHQKGALGRGHWDT